MNEFWCFRWRGVKKKKTCEPTEEVQVSALFAVPVWALGHRGVRPQDAVGARRHVEPLMLVDGGVEMNYHRQTGDGSIALGEFLAIARNSAFGLKYMYVQVTLVPFPVKL